MAEAQNQLSVMIVGAGLGGLTLALLLEKAKIGYHVYEKAVEVKPLGSTIALGPNIMPLLTQLELLDEFCKISKPVRYITVHKENNNMRPMGRVDIEEHIEKSGYPTRVCARPEFYDLLLSKIPKEKIHLNQRIVSIHQDENLGVRIETSKGQFFTGDVLVGADGAYSNVRQSLYEQLKVQDLLPASDQEKMVVNHTTMVGLTSPLDPEQYPALKDTAMFSHSDWVIGQGPFTWNYFSLADNRIGWGVGVQVREGDHSKEDGSLRTAWGPGAAEALCEEIKDFRIPLGGTMGDLIRASPKDCIAKVLLEEKLFETWYHQRTVLMGDACHKILPYVGQGAVNAMEDAVILANALYEIRDVTSKNITAAFEDYRTQRYAHAAEQCSASKMFTMLMVGQKWYEDLLRRFVLSVASKFFQRQNYAKTLNYRPQASFLERVPDRGTIPVLPQKVSLRYTKEQAALQRKQQEPEEGELVESIPVVAVT
ncbi:hypothetical protein BGZ47_010268 [Haplosporangium gracile]|nr:hypothetical protein BGZ47_010268 [Haplosporangium gracile]